MIFSSLLFLFKFIPIFFIIYYLCPAKIKNVVLLLGSIIFYAWGEPKFLILIIISILVNYAMGLLIDFFDKKQKSLKKLAFAVAIIYDLSMLFVFKYADFFIENINRATGSDISALNLTLPLGISFYTFQIMSYVIDLYKGQIKVERSVVVLGTYLSMFPQLIA